MSRDFTKTIMWHGLSITYGFIDEGGLQHGDRYFIKIDNEMVSAKHIKTLVDILEEFNYYTAKQTKHLEEYMNNVLKHPDKRAGNENAPYPPNNVKDKDD